MFDIEPRRLAPLPSKAAIPTTFAEAERLAGDHTLFGDNALVLKPVRLRPAAVLVPIIAHPHGPTVLLTQRQEKLRRHSGQISFPGGRIDADDPDPVTAALREAEEEIALPRQRVRVVGALSTYITGTGFAVAPIVGVLQPGFEPMPCADEVAAVFEVPLAFLLDQANHRCDTLVHDGVSRQFWAMPYGERYIWGATAGMLRDLWQRLSAP